MRTFRRICVYCGSSDAVAPRYLELARQMGQELVRRGIGLVFGGGRVGLMGAIADAVLAEGGTVHGVIPRKLYDREVGHEGVTELFVVDSMHDRKLMMAQLSDAFIALPGGWGTLEELFEVTTWTQLRYHDKPVGVLDAFGYYQALRAFIAHAAGEGFIRPQHVELMTFAESPGALVDALATLTLPDLDKWLGPGAAI